MVVYHSYVAVYQRVNLHFPRVFLWFSYGFPIKRGSTLVASLPGSEIGPGSIRSAKAPLIHEEDLGSRCRKHGDSPPSLDWFCWENLNRKPWFLPSNIGPKPTQWSLDWFCWENLQETIDVPIKYGVFYGKIGESMDYYPLVMTNIATV